MAYKKDIEKLLFILKSAKISRARIEADLRYSEDYIDQVLSKGGNKKFYNNLKEYAGRVLQKAIPDEDKGNGVLQNSANVTQLYSLAELKKKLEEQWQLIISQQETILINARRAPNLDEKTKNA